MRVLRANSRILGLEVGETFESDSPFYDPFIKQKHLSDVTPRSAPQSAPAPAALSPAGESGSLTSVEESKPEKGTPAPAEESSTSEEAPEASEAPAAPKRRSPAKKAPAKKSPAKKAAE